MIDNDKNEFYKQYKHDIDINDIKINLKEKKERCCI